MLVTWNGRIIFGSSAAVNFLGVGSPDDLLGKSLMMFFPPDDREMLRETPQRLPSQEFLLRIDNRMIRPDGTQLIVDVISHPIIFQCKPATLVVLRDVGEQWLAKEKLQQSEASLATAQRITGVGNWEQDVTDLNVLHSRPLRCSAEVFRIFGLDPAQGTMSREEFQRILHPDDLERVQDAFLRVIRESKSFSHDYRIIRPDGMERTIHSELEVLRSPLTLNVVKVIGVVQDVTSRKKQENKFLALLEGVPEAVVVVNKEGILVLINARAETMFGYSREELLHQTMEVLLPERLRGQHHGHRTQFPATPISRSMAADLEPMCRRKDGTEFPAEISMNTVETDDGILISTVIIDITQRKRSEAELRQASDIVRSSNDGITSTTVDGIVSSWNSAAERIFGLTAGEAIGQSIANLSIPDLPNGPLELNAKAISGEHIVNFETTRKRKDGTAVDVALTLSPIRDSRNNIVGTSSIVRDISARKYAEVELRRYAEIVLSSSDAIISRTLDGTITSWNPSAERMFGYTAEEVVGKPFIRFVPPESSERALEVMAIANRGGQVINHESVRMRKDGTKVWIALTLSPVKDKNGEVEGCSAICRDITESRKASERFFTAFNLSPEAMTIATASEGRYIEVNESFLRVTGFKREQVTGRTSLELNFWDQPEDRADFIQRVMAEGSVRNLKVTFCTNGGERRQALVSADLIDLGGQKCILALFMDITEKMILEEQLRHSQKMEAVGRLSGGIAHDFNNLVGVITGYSQILMEGLDPASKFYNDAKEISKAGRRAASLTQQLLAFSRRQILLARVLDLNAIVFDMTEMLWRLIGENIRLTSKLEPELWHVKVDKSQIEQVIVNLMVNARDSMPKGGELTLETKNVQLGNDDLLGATSISSGDYILFAVTDTGVGMDAQTQEHIFEPFFTTKEFGKGTGLGLAMVYGFVKQSGGKISVYSELGGGSTFNIYLPRAEQAFQLPSSMVPANSSQRSETVLLVEDEESIRTLIRRFLEEGGYTVLEANSGQQATEITRQHHGPIHLLLTDMVMPDTNGCELAKKLRSSRPELRTLYMSGYVNLADGKAEDFGPLLLKPFSCDDLLFKLHEVLSTQKETTST